MKPTARPPAFSRLELPLLFLPQFVAVAPLSPEEKKPSPARGPKAAPVQMCVGVFSEGNSPRIEGLLR